MARLAALRAVVILDNGRTAHLVFWPLFRFGPEGGVRRCRVQFRPGSCATLPLGRVVGVDLSTADLQTGPPSDSVSV